MSEFYDISFTTNNIVSLGLTVLLLFLIPIVFWVAWHKSHKGELKLKYLLFGAIGFIVSVRVLELGVHAICIMSDNPISRFINGNTVAYVLYGIVMAGVFEECGRYIIFKYILKKDKTRENVVLYGIGHAGIEVWTVVLPMILLELAVAVMFSSGDISSALSTLNITEETAVSALPTVLSASQFGIGMLLLFTLERIFVMVIHIGLTVIVFYGVSEKRKVFLCLAILLHMLVDVFPALYQRAVIPMWLCEVWLAVWVVIIVILSVKLYKKIKIQAEG